jgi:thiopeptide-type bacteriocin biosynthesis protein
MMVAPNPADWIYFKLYLGEAAIKVDSLIVDLARALVAFDRFERWFFLRYIDKGGAHLRVRVQARPGELAETTGAIRQICARSLEKLPTLPVRGHRPMVVPLGANMSEPNGPPLEGGRRASVRVESEVYEPELDKFGGVEGMAVAEDNFDASSRIAWQLLAAEVEGKASRKTVVPCFMAEAIAAFPPAVGLREFWREVALRWLGGDTPAAREWRDRFLEKGQQLRAEGVSVLAREDQLSPVEAEAVSAWRTALRKAAEGYARVRDRGNATNDVLAFNLNHLMSNRLGLTALEEAYMATLVEQQLAETPA